ncbi:unnamed protein product, partial [Cuscuta campestris]
MDEEFIALNEQRTWDLVPPPKNRTLIGCKWVYRIKRNADGSVSRHCSRGTIVVLVYVDDIVLTGSSSTLISEVTQAMHRDFKLKELGPLHYFLG